MNMKDFLLIILLNLIITRVLSFSTSTSRTPNGVLYPRKRFIPSENHFYLGLHRSRDRLRCIKLCQESSLCQTVMYDRIKQECTLFSEHIEYDFGRLYEETNENLITIRLDKDSLQNVHQIRKNDKKQSSVLFTSYRKNKDDICEKCELR